MVAVTMESTDMSGHLEKLAQRVPELLWERVDERLRADERVLVFEAVAESQTYSSGQENA